MKFILSFFVLLAATRLAETGISCANGICQASNLDGDFQWIKWLPLYVNELYIKDSNFTDIPKWILEEYIVKEKLQLSGCGLRNLSADSLDRIVHSASSLYFLDLSRNEFTSLYSGMFRYAPDLAELILSNGQIDFVSSDTFAELFYLDTLDLSGNKISTISAKLFADLKLLHFLDMSRNKLKIIEDNVFSNNKYLWDLRFDSNRIESIGSLHYLNDLRSFSAANNSLTAFNSTNTLKSLNIEGNHIQRIYLGPNLVFFDGKNNLIRSVTCNTTTLIIQTLLLSNNLFNASECLQHATKLEELDLSYNLLGSINFLKNLKNLRTLQLSHTNLATLSADTFTSQKRLHWIDISYNNLESLPMNLFNANPDLEYLLIDGNNFTEIPLISHLKAIYGIEGFSFNCSYLNTLTDFYKFHGTKIVTNRVAKGFNIQGIPCTRPRKEKNLRDKDVLKELIYYAPMLLLAFVFVLAVALLIVCYEVYLKYRRNLLYRSLQERVTVDTEAFAECEVEDLNL